ncbi:hypothetical protein LUZ60_002646 [Juncus effusus]|nr:hypothetical protein LUZ60_002646 [Juncus effusus]
MESSISNEELDQKIINQQIRTLHTLCGPVLIPPPPNPHLPNPNSDSMAATSDETIAGVAALKKASPGMPWGQAETFHLIDAYEEQCLSLKRRQLKAPEWETVATAVAARSGTGGLGQVAAKSGTQCRHKIEKLRKRFKAESARPVRSFWPFFERLARLEHGPVPVAACAPTDRITRSSDGEEDHENDDDAVSNIKSINGGLKSKPKEDNEEQCEEEAAGGGGGLSMTEVVRGFGDEVVKMEKRQMEIMREMERDRMEMETKREKMIIEAQRYLVECIAEVFHGGPRKKAKKSHNLFQ